jgi:pimeloyl-ACP methyl ester carboxylesterase
MRVFHTKAIRGCSHFLCLIPAVLLTGCASTILLHPQIARNAFAHRPTDPVQNGDSPEVVIVINASGHKLFGWAFASPTNHGVVLVGDGNASGIAHTYDYNRHLLHRGFNVVFLSYQGFDANEGKADVHSLFGDVQAFYRACRERFPGQPIALLGESLSAGVFFCFASRHREITCMVLEGAVDLKRVAFTHLYESWLLYPFFPITFPAAVIISAGVPADLNAQNALAREPAVPALFIHHSGDPITPYSDACRIFEGYDGPKEFIVPRIDPARGFHMTGNFDSAVRSRVIRFLQTGGRLSSP